MTIVWGRRFRRDFAALPSQIKERARSRLALLCENPRHPSLRTKKMAGRPEVWEGRVTRDYGFTFSPEGDTYTLRRIGTHDILRTP